MGIVGRPFPKGQSGNPGGAPKLPAELRAARRENLQALIRLVHAYAGMTQEEVTQRLSGNEAVQLEEMVQGQIKKASEGDHNAFKFIIELMCGKIPEQDDSELSLEKLTTAEKLTAMKQAVTFLEAQMKQESQTEVSQ